MFYYTIPARFRVFFLLLSSCYFYMSFVPKYILILFFLITVDYFLAKSIDKRKGRDRKIFLIVSVMTNIGTLLFFKYFNFFNENIATLVKFLHWNYSPVFLQILLPLGLSFHVFQSLSYVIEVYKGKHKPEKNFVNYALYVMFFPQLVAGPIERPQHLLPQFNIKHNFNSLNVRRGLERMLWGFFKKLVIADQIAVIINPIFTKLPTDSPTLIFLVLIFSYQLYCDFSGYSDIALGSAQVLGLNLKENFNRPFSATSISDFWQRWHISLSSWLRDYLYYPLALGWGKVSRIRLYASSIITFFLIGLWHGANWTFVIMGTMHGFYIVIGSMTLKIRQRFFDLIGLSKFPKIRHFIKVLTVYALVSISFLFFRAENVRQAFWIIGHLGTNISSVFSYTYLHNYFFRGLGLSKLTSSAMFISIIVMEIVQYYQSKYANFYIFDTKLKFIRYAWYYSLIMTILVFGFFGAEAFIYFKF